MCYSDVSIPYNHAAVGKCSLCGGLVVVPTITCSVVPPVPFCMKCGATVKPSEPFSDLPTIPMIPRQHQKYDNISYICDDKTQPRPDVRFQYFESTID